MAFRIEDSVVRGEIDNRVKGIVRGRIWLEGCSEPVILELQGNAWPDLAGCLLTFTNPQKRSPHQHLDSLHPLQRGSIGDLTASRKVRVFDIPLEDALAMIRRKERPPEHLANSLYLEWFSDYNGRVVIESADYELTISEPEWWMTPEENEERAQQAANGMGDFMKKLSEAVDPDPADPPDAEEEWDEHDYEKFLKEADARTDKYMELLEKYGESDEAEQKIAEEMGWARELTPEEAEAESRRIDELNAAGEEAANEPEPEPDPQREGIDWIRTPQGDLRHPLQHRCFESALKYWRQVEGLGLEKADGALEDFTFEFQSTACKLAGALGPIARGWAMPEPAFTVAYLKRALGRLHQALAALEAAALEKLLPEAMAADARKELLEIREGILRLMDELRQAP